MRAEPESTGSEEEKKQSHTKEKKKRPVPLVWLINCLSRRYALTPIFELHLGTPDCCLQTLLYRPFAVVTESHEVFPFIAVQRST